MQCAGIDNDWIFRDNLTAFLYLVARRAKYDLLSEEVQAIELGVRGTNQERERCYTVELAGDQQVRVSFVIDSGNGEDRRRTRVLRV